MGSIKVESMQKTAARPMLALAFAITMMTLATLIPGRAFAAGIDPSLIPDGS
jgi:hypothetical protein